MYNRYLSPEQTPYTPVGSDTPSPAASDATASAPPPPPSGNGAASPVERIQNLLGLGGEGRRHEESMLRRLLARFHLEDVDTGDLMLLILLFFLLEEKADDELIVALGLLLIL